MLAHLDDVCSDLSVFHGVKDASRLDAVTFHKLVYRLAAYQGAVAARAAAQQERGSGAGSPRAVQPGGSADVRARLRASQAMPVASAAELMALRRRCPGCPPSARSQGVAG